MKKTFSLLLCLTFCLSLSLGAFASGEASENGPMPNMSAGSGTATYTISDDGLETDDALVNIEMAAGAVVSAEEISGVRITSTENAAGGVEYTGSGDLTIGGAADNFTVTTYFTGEELSFNTVIDLREADDYVWGSDSTGGVAIAARGSGEMNLENVYALDTGVGRYTVSLSSGTTIIKNSYFESVGCNAEYCDMPWFTAQLGNARNLIACGTLSAYIYNSTVASEGYGSWSTDTGGNPYVFYLYNGDAINRFGGYGTYADTGLEVFMYGSRFDSAEYGAFCTNTGILNIGSSSDALKAEDEIFLANLQGQELPEDTPSEIVANQNAIVFHVVDTMHKANPDTGVKDSAVSAAWTTTPILNVTNSVLSTVDAIAESANKYPVIQQAWLDHLKGATILFRGACGVANLENTVLESSNGVIIQSCVDLDESTIQILDDVATEDIPGCQVNSVNNVWAGNILNEDYQRPMYLDFVNTELTGAIITTDNTHWNALFAEYADVAYEQDAATGLYVNTADPTETGSNFRVVDPSSIYGWLCAFEDYAAVRGTFLTMDADSVWNVTEASNLNGLTVEAGAVINGVVTVDGVTVEVSAGGSWTGDIVVTPAQQGASSEEPMASNG
ncbi:MAG: hypothetical protein ACI3W7_04255 [Oscillospiraceae bacterium]